MSDHKELAQPSPSQKEDEIAWRIIDQLHQATSQVSATCFEYKKLCVTMIAAVFALMKGLGGGVSIQTILLLCLGICVGFWMADATSYYYQRALRNNMNKRINALAERNQCEAREKPVPYTALNSAFNSSMIMYYALSAVILAWILFPS